MNIYDHAETPAFLFPFFLSFFLAESYPDSVSLMSQREVS
jgi:hypothetical protein